MSHILGNGQKNGPATFVSEGWNDLDFLDALLLCFYYIYHDIYHDMYQYIYNSMYHSIYIDIYNSIYHYIYVIMYL